MIWWLRQFRRRHQLRMVVECAEVHALVAMTVKRCPYDCPVCPAVDEYHGIIPEYREIQP